MPVRLVDLHEDFSALSHQTRMLPIKPNFAHRHPRHSLGDTLPIYDYVKKNPNIKDKVLASDAPALNNANVALVVACSYCNSDGSFHELYPWHKNFYANLFRERSDLLIPIFTTDELTKSLNTPHKTAVIRSIEGIYQWNGDLDLIDMLWADGIRSIIPVHNEDSNIGTGCLTKKNHGLTQLGKTFMKKVIEQGFIVDLSHLSDQTAKDVLVLLKKSERPPIISHTGSRSIVPDQQRSTHDAIAIEVAERGGIIGIMPTSWLVEKDPTIASVDSVIRTIDHYLNLFWENNITNPEEKIAIGTDFCGMGTESIIKEIETIEKLGPALQKAMKKYKYPQNVIEKIFSENAITYFLKWLPQ